MIDRLQKKHSIAIFIDISKAFDMVWHPTILIKMLQMGIRGNIYNYVKNFLQNRTFRVQIKNTQSTIRQIINGTPQGSSLSPTLFNIATHDLRKITADTKTQLTQFADDSSLYNSHIKIEYLIQDLQNTLKNLEDWTNKWGFDLAPDKTTAIDFTNPRDRKYPTIKLKQSNIKYSKTHKFLGITFDENINFNQHIENTLIKTNKTLNILKTTKGKDWGADTTTLLTAIRALIYSVIDY